MTDNETSRNKVDQLAGETVEKIQYDMNKTGNISRATCDDFGVVLSFDRSGSMIEFDMESVVEEIASFALALEQLDINICLIDVYGKSTDNEVQIVSPFDKPLEDTLDSILSEKTSGGTPLSTMLETAQDHCDKHVKDTIILSVTDGLPNNTEQYRKQLNACQMPVFGGIMIHDQYTDSHNNITGYQGKQQEFYDTASPILGENEISDTLINFLTDHFTQETLPEKVIELAKQKEITEKAFREVEPDTTEEAIISGELSGLNQALDAIEELYEWEQMPEWNIVIVCENAGKYYYPQALRRESAIEQARTQAQKELAGNLTVKKVGGPIAK